MSPVILSSTTLTAETLVIDPVSEDADNDPVDLIATGAIYGVLEHSYPAAPLEVQYAGTVDTEGDVPVSRRYRNRTITLKIDCPDYTSWLTLQAKVAKLGRKGGTLRRDLPSGDVRIYDIIASPQYDAAFTQEFYAGVTTVDLQLDAEPFARGESVTLADHVETTSPTLIFTETIEGDVAPDATLTVDDDSGAFQGSLRWAVQNTYYDSAALASLFYEAETRAMFNGAAAAVGTAGASGAGSNVAKQTGLTTSFLTQIVTHTGSDWNTHVGTYRLFGRFYAPAANAGVVQVQLQYFAPNAPVGKTNDAVTVTEAAWQFLDLGEVTIAAAANGVQGWQGLVTAKSTSAGDDLEIDYLVLFPLDDAYGEASSDDLLLAQTVIANDYVENGATGGRFGRPQVYRGDYLRMQPGTNRFVLKFSRGIGDSSDTNVDDLSARLTYTPRFLI